MSSSSSLSTTGGSVVLQQKKAQLAAGIAERNARLKAQKQARIIGALKLTAKIVWLAAAAGACFLLAQQAGAAELPAQAQISRWSLDISTTSYHTRNWARESLNQDNPGLGLQYQYNENLGFAGGAYENSYSRTSVYALALYTPAHLNLPFGFTASAGIAAGAVGGYTHSEAPGRPGALAALLEVRSAGGYGVNIVAVPNAGQSAGFVGLQLVVPLAVAF
ncbi:MAG: hypothetical protein M0Z99_34770 [Betaproteobacteria bacterium]|nr:hypothetical protein [Betaproteobacteria bacterium]